MKIFCVLLIACLLCKEVAAQCSAGITYNANGLVTKFFDASTGADASTTYLWYFGDGDSSALKNPVHTYHVQGIYTVCHQINVVDDSCVSQSCDTLQLLCRDTAYFLYENPDDNEFGTTEALDASVGEDSSVTYLWTSNGDTIQNPQGIEVYDTVTLCLAIDNIDQNCISKFCRAITDNSCSVSTEFSSYIAITPSGTSFNAIIDDDWTDTTYIAIWNYGNGVIDTLYDAVYQSAPNFPNGIGNICLTIIQRDSGCFSEYCTGQPSCPSAYFSYYFSNDTVFFQGFGYEASYIGWSFGDGSYGNGASQWHVYAEPGNYQICQTVTESSQNDDGYENQCTVQNCDNITVTGINNIKTATSSISIFPNPVVEAANIQMNQFRANSIRILNALGQEVKRIEVGAKSLMSIDVTGLASGLYIVQVSGASDTVSLKMLVSK